MFLFTNSKLVWTQQECGWLTTNVNVQLDPPPSLPSLSGPHLTNLNSQAPKKQYWIKKKKKKVVERERDTAQKRTLFERERKKPLNNVCKKKAKSSFFLLQQSSSAFYREINNIQIQLFFWKYFFKIWFFRFIRSPDFSVSALSWLQGHQLENLPDLTLTRSVGFLKTRVCLSLGWVKWERETIYSNITVAMVISSHPLRFFDCLLYFLNQFLVFFFWN